MQKLSVEIKEDGQGRLIKIEESKIVTKYEGDKSKLEKFKGECQNQLRELMITQNPSPASEKLTLNSAELGKPLPNENKPILKINIVNN